MRETDPPASFGASLRRHRLAAGLSQVALAARAGLSARAISDLERGVRHAPYPRTVRQLATALRLPTAELAGQLGGVSPGRIVAAPPMPLTSFVGRTRELAEVVRWLGEVRLLSLVGPGGVGKTRLALQVVARLPAGLGGAVAWVDLAPLAEAGLVTPTVLAALGLPEQPGRAPRDTLAAAVQARRLLLVLDNCEHLVAGCAELVAHLLPTCPDLRVLATSRRPLEVAGEAIWRVPSLGQPAAAATPAPEAVARDEAAQLFVARARLVRPDFALTARTAPAVARIRGRLDGIPLALELAAARLEALTVEDLAARLDDSLGLLTGGRTAPPRHRTLRATLDWDHDLLTERERVLLRRLAVFAGGCTLAAAEAVCGEPASLAPRPPPGADHHDRGTSTTGEGRRVAGGSVLDTLARLIGQSLVQMEERDGEARYRLLETVRQYARERLHVAGEAAALGARHAAYFLALAGTAPRPRTAEAEAWLARLEAEHVNLREALAWALEGDPALALRLVGSLWRFWQRGGHLTEGRHWLEAALAGDQERAGPRLAVLLGAGELAIVQGDLPAARRWLAEAVTLSRALDAAPDMAAAPRGLGLVYSLLGDQAEAWPLLEESLTIARRTGDRLGQGKALRILGYLGVNRADFGQAWSHLTEALGLLRQEDELADVPYLLRDLSRIALRQGDAVRARALAAESLAAAEAQGLAYQIGLIQSHVGDVALQRGDLAAARAHFTAGLALARQVGDRIGASSNLIGLGQVARRADDLALAEAALTEGLMLATAADDGQNATLAHHELGLIAQHRGEAARAREHLQTALMIGHQYGNRQAVIEAVEALAALSADARRPLPAARLLGATAALRAALGLPLLPAEQTMRDKATDAARSSPGSAGFAAAWAAGAALDLTAAIAAAMALDLSAPVPGIALRPVPGATATRQADGTPSETLTAREREVLRLLAAGATDASIARELCISVRTVGNHVASILAKTGSANRAAAAALAVRRGLV